MRQRSMRSSDYDASVFETTIRVAGGMLAAYDLTGDEMYVRRTAELVDRLLPAFETPTGLPHNIINLKTLEARNPAWARSVCCLFLVWWLLLPTGWLCVCVCQQCIGVLLHPNKYYL